MLPFPPRLPCGLFPFFFATGSARSVWTLSLLNSFARHNIWQGVAIWSSSLSRNVLVCSGTVSLFSAPSVTKQLLPTHKVGQWKGPKHVVVLYVIDYTYLYHHIVVLDNYTHSYLVLPTLWAICHGHYICSDMKVSYSVSSLNCSPLVQSATPLTECAFTVCYTGCFYCGSLDRRADVTVAV